MRSDPLSDSLPFMLEEKSVSSFSDERVLRHLAHTLSVPKTLKRFPSLKTKDLQEILWRSARRAEKNDNASPVIPREKGILEFIIHTDGASRGNPGEAGIGIVISDVQGRTVKEIKGFLGVATNNVAEYRGLILALKTALRLGAGRVTIYLDSELVVRQLRGEYKVRESHLKILHQEAQAILNRFSGYDLQYIPREENRRADQLANDAINQKIRIEEI